MNEDQRLEQPESPRTPGRALAAARAERGLTVTEIALRLKYAPKQIEALEADRYEALAGPAFVRGMLRSYAKLLGIDADPLVASLGTSLPPPPPQLVAPAHRGEVPFPTEARKGSLVYLVLSVLLVIAVVGVVVEWMLRPEPPAAVATPRPPVPGPLAAATTEPRETDVAAAPEPAPAPVPDPAAGSGATFASGAAPIAPMQTAPRAGEGQIVLEFNSESWVEVRDGEGHVLLSQLNPPGSRHQLAGAGPFKLVIGNARGVKLTYNENAVDLAPFTRTDVARLTLE
jgi:cytoskeleton protein RodZ